MGMRFNTPPNWPQPPSGWTPPEGWQPDPSWGPAPYGWEFWVEEAPRRRRRTWLAIVGGIVGVLVVASIANGGGDPSTSSSEAAPAPAAPSPTRDATPSPSETPSPPPPEPSATPSPVAPPRLADVAPASPKAKPKPKLKPKAKPKAKPVYYRNCDAVRAAGKAPLRRGEPGFRDALDADDDGVACEPYSGPKPKKKAEAPAPAPEPGPEPDGDTDPRFGTCREAKSNGYGPYREGRDPEYDWYRDADSDGIVCE